MFSSKFSIQISDCNYTKKNITYQIDRLTRRIDNLKSKVPSLQISEKEIEKAFNELTYLDEKIQLHRLYQKDERELLIKHLQKNKEYELKLHENTIKESKQKIKSLKEKLEILNEKIEIAERKLKVVEKIEPFAQVLIDKNESYLKKHFDEKMKKVKLKSYDTYESKYNDFKNGIAEGIIHRIFDIIEHQEIDEILNITMLRDDGDDGKIEVPNGTIRFHITNGLHPKITVNYIKIGE